MDGLDLPTLPVFLDAEVGGVGRLQAELHAVDPAAVGPEGSERVGDAVERLTGAGLKEAGLV